MTEISEYQDNIYETEYNLQCFNDLFNSVLDKDEESLKLFENFVLKYGISVINNLIKITKYKRNKELLKHILNIYKDLLLNSIDSPVELIFGCYFKNNYLIIIKNYSDKKYKIINSNPNKTIYKNKLNEVVKDYNKLIKKNWIPMNIDDIINITGITINNDTITNISKIYDKSWKHNNIVKNIIKISFGISLFCIIKKFGFKNKSQTPILIQNKFLKINKNIY